MIRKLGTTVLVALSLTALPGCMGRMAVTSSVQKFNLNVVDSGWGRETLFVVLHVIPVYPICAGIDLLLVNSLEFWKGENPISEEPALVDEE